MKTVWMVLLGTLLLLVKTDLAEALVCQQFGTTTICDNGVTRQQFGTTTIITGGQGQDQRDQFAPLVVLPPQPASPGGQPQPLGLCIQINGLTYCY